MDKQQRGFSLIEVLVTIIITLIVMMMVFSIAQMIRSVYAREFRTAEVSSGVARALDDVALELARAGYGLGEGVPPILPYHGNHSPSSNAISIWSNPSGASGVVLSGSDSDDSADSMTRVQARQVGLDVGDHVVLIDEAGTHFRAEVTEIRPGIESSDIALRELEPNGESEQAERTGNRVLAMSEVSYYLEASPVVGKRALVKHTASGSRVLTPWLDDVRFDYLDDAGGSIAPAMLEQGAPLATVKITMTYSFESSLRKRRILTTAVTLDQQSMSVDFAERGYGFRLARYFHPIESPAAVAMRSYLRLGCHRFGGS